MNRKTYLGYLSLIEKYASHHVKVIDNDTLEIRGVSHIISKYNFADFAEVVLYTDHLQNLTYKEIRNLFRALQKANYPLWYLYYDAHLYQSKELIELFIQIVNTKDPVIEKELLQQLYDYLHQNQKAS